MMIDTSDMRTESDVEQKLIMPLLVLPKPQGLGISVVNIRTKPDIRRYAIGKGREQKLYYPDYLIIISGLPILIVEAKAPGENLLGAYREARLYATEVNAQFPSGLNPVSKIICTNGQEIIAGYWDSDAPNFTVRSEYVESTNPIFAKFVDFVSASTLDTEASRLLQQLTKRPFTKPTKLLGGQSVRNEEIGHNAFGSTLSLDYRYLFNPTSKKERAFIAKNAYIPSKRREQYIQPIDKIIRAAAPPSETDATLITNTGEPREIITALRKTDIIEQQVLLLIGNVGAGKSTFVDYLREVALPDDLINITVWLHINMNNAPINGEYIYDWLYEQITFQLKSIHKNRDFDELEEIEKVYSVELNTLKKGALKLLQRGTAEYNVRLADEIIRLQTDKQTTAKAFVRYLCGERGRLLVIVLDNCDKRIRDEQLLMFQAAQWLQQQFRSLIILPLRDETYDNHRNEPPLDTALKDLVFRIEPPLFQAVLNKRIAIALSEMKGQKELSYTLPNGMRVEYPATEQAFYLSTILRSIFEYDKFLRGIIVGLAGRDMRKAMEIFLEFCTSGHIGEDEIFKIRAAKGKYILPYNVVAQVLLRRNRRFYDGDGDYSYIKNIFSCVPEDSKPTYFTRLIILRWLEQRWKRKGPSGIVGYHQIKQLKTSLVPLGLNDLVINREIVFLLRARCITAEHLRLDIESDDDLIRLAPAGFVHLDLVSNIEYLAAVSEDTWFDEESIATAIANRIGGNQHYTFNTMVKDSRNLIDYLRQKLDDPFPSPSSYLEGNEWQNLLNIESARKSVEIAEKRIRVDPWITANDRYRRGQIVKGVVTGANEYGLFVKLEAQLEGLVGMQQLSSLTSDKLQEMVGQEVQVRILWINGERRRMRLALVS